MSSIFFPQYAPSRLQIEKSIMNLEQRLIRRKELDLQIQKQLLEQQSINKKNKIIPANKFFSPLYPVYGIEKQLDQRLMLLKGLGSRKQLEKGLHKQQFDYVIRLKALQRQQQMMAHELALRRKQDSLYGKEMIKNNLDQFQEESQVLARKYLNGTRAIEFSQQLKRAQSLNSRKALFTKEKSIAKPTHNIRQHSSVKKYMTSELKNDLKNDLKSDVKNYTRNDSSIFNRTIYIDPTPIKLIDDSKKTKNQQLLKLQNQISQKKKEIANHLKQIEEKQSSDDSLRLQSKATNKYKDKSTRPTTQFLKVTSGNDFIQKHHISRPLSVKKSSRFLSSRHQSVKNLRSHQQSTQLRHQDVQQHIHKQIKIRARVSQQVKEVLDIFYAKNVSEYLITVYQKEDKLRKQLKQKISKIPAIQRKFDVGSVPE